MFEKQREHGRCAGDASGLPCVVGDESDKRGPGCLIWDVHSGFSFGFRFKAFSLCSASRMSSSVSWPVSIK